MKGGSLLAIMVMALLLGIWELMHHWWFWVGAAVVACLCWAWHWHSEKVRKEQAAQRRASAWRPPPPRATPAPNATPSPELKDYVPHISVDDQGMLSMTLPDNASLPPPTGDVQFDALLRSRILDQWDAARKKLQQISYGMVDATPEAKAEFTKLMKVFAARDPLLSSILGTVMPIVRSTPGVLQTALYKHLPGIGPEEARYAFYFAEQLGILRREKKGNTYRLLPAGEVITV